jgi:hypothetical protein
MFASAEIHDQLSTKFLSDPSLLIAPKLCFSELDPEGIEKSCTIPLLWGKTPNDRRCLLFLPPQVMQLSLLAITRRLQRGSFPFKQDMLLVEALILLRYFLQLLVLHPRVTLPYFGLITSMMQLRQNCVDSRMGNLTVPLSSLLLLLSLSERLSHHLPLALDCLIHHLLRGQMPEPYLFLLLAKVLVYILLCMLEHRLTMEYLLSFLLYSLRLPLFLIEQILDIDGNVHLDATRDLSGTNASRVPIGTMKVLRSLKRG